MSYMQLIAGVFKSNANEYLNGYVHMYNNNNKHVVNTFINTSNNWQRH